MRVILRYLISLAREEQGQDMVEYALLAGFVAVAAATALPDIGHQIWHIFDNLEELVDNAAGA